MATTSRAAHTVAIRARRRSAATGIVPGSDMPSRTAAPAIPARPVTRSTISPLSSHFSGPSRDRMAVGAAASGTDNSPFPLSPSTVICTFQAPRSMIQSCARNSLRSLRSRSARSGTGASSAPSPRMRVGTTCTLLRLSERACTSISATPGTTAGMRTTTSNG